MNLVLTGCRRACGARSAARHSTNGRPASMAGDTADQSSQTRHAADDPGIMRFVRLSLQAEEVSPDADR